MLGQPGRGAVRIVAQQRQQLVVDGQPGGGGDQDERADLVGPGERRLERDQRAQRVPDQHRRAEAERAAELADGVAVAFERQASARGRRARLGPWPGRSIATAWASRATRASIIVQIAGAGAAPWMKTADGRSARRSPRSA